jgi:uncharacterized lipoprotein YddW (UPF0748 family)
MAPGFRAAVSASVLIASIWMLWEPLPPGGASAFSEEEAAVDTLPADAPYLERLRASTPILPDDEIRALWVVRDALTTPESINRLIDFAVQTRTHLLFVQVRGRGDVFYRSSIDPPASVLAAPLADFDPLAYLIELAGRQGISVHAWLNVFLIWSSPTETPPPSHIMATHPEWLLTDARGRRMDRVPRSQWKKLGIEGYFVSPSVPAMRRHMARVVRELVESYPIDGVHLDYIRYPGREFAYDPVSRSEFAVRWGVDPAELVDGDRKALQSALGASGLALVDSLSSAQKRLDVDSMVVAIRGACEGRALSAAVVADPAIASMEKWQNWEKWVNQGWMDFVVPMAYNFPPLELEHRAQVYQRMVGRDRVLIGLGVFDGREEYLAESVELLRGVGVAGYALFSYNALAEGRYGAALIEDAVLPPDTSGTDEDDESVDEDVPEDDDSDEE